MTQGLIGLLALVNTVLAKTPAYLSPLSSDFAVEQSQKQVLALKNLSLTNRYDNDFVNDVFKDNIILSLYYLKGAEVKKEVDWDKVKKPFETSFILKPGDIFAFHDNVLKEYQDQVVKTMNSHFIGQESYRNSGYLYGDGVCHLASLFNWAASEAGLEVIALVNHDFRLIPDIPKSYGTSIKYDKSGGNSQNQNLYIKNNYSFDVVFRFEVEEGEVKLKIVQI